MGEGPLFAIPIGVFVPEWAGRYLARRLTLALSRLWL